MFGLMFGMFWPFDFSFSGFIIIMLLMLWWLMYSIGHVAKETAKVAKKVLENETVQEVGKDAFASWWKSLLK